MSCACYKRRSPSPEYKMLNLDLQKDMNNAEEENEEEHLTLPFETCIECCKKHLSYALVLEAGFDSYRTLGQLYLAYKHLEKFYVEEAKMLFEIIKDYFNSFKADTNKINEFIYMLNKMEVKEVEDGKCLNLEEKTFDQPKLYILYLVAANELLNFEVAYFEVNKPYAIGLILRAAEMVPEATRLKLRNLWKSNDNDIFSKLNTLLKEEIKTYKVIFISK